MTQSESIRVGKKKRVVSASDRLTVIAELGREFRENPEMVFRVHLGQCSTFLGFAIDHARNLVKCGQKDEARVWFKFLNNSKVLDVVSYSLGPEAVSQMRHDLSCLGTECHPLDVPNFTNVLESIDSRLNELLVRTGGIEQSPKISVFNPKP